MEIEVKSNSKQNGKELNAEYSITKKCLSPTYAIFLQTAKAQKRISFSSCHLHLYKKQDFNILNGNSTA